MFLYKNKIVITGGSGRFGSELKKVKNKYKLLFPDKRELNILNLKTIKKYLMIKSMMNIYLCFQLIPLRTFLTYIILN